MKTDMKNDNFGTLHTFTTQQRYEGQPRVTVVSTTNAEVLGDVLAKMENHLRGAGFVFDGHLEIVDGAEESPCGRANEVSEP